MSGDGQVPEADGSARIDAMWGGAKRNFRLGLRECRELQRLTGFGPEHLLRRIGGGEWFIDEPIAILQLGLESAGTAPNDAAALVARYGPGARPANESLPIAIKALAAVLSGVAFDKLGKS